jgi:hypothetical protein
MGYTGHLVRDAAGHLNHEAAGGHLVHAGTSVTLDRTAAAYKYKYVNVVGWSAATAAIAALSWSHTGVADGPRCWVLRNVTLNKWYIEYQATAYDTRTYNGDTVTNVEIHVDEDGTSAPHVGRLYLYPHSAQTSWPSETTIASGPYIENLGGTGWQSASPTGTLVLNDWLLVMARWSPWATAPTWLGHSAFASFRVDDIPSGINLTLTS